MTARPATRGPYAKGRAKRQEIIDVALDVLAVNGLRHSSLQEIASRAGITRQGLLHYFPSRENLLVAVLEARDARDIAAGLAGHHPGEPPGDVFERELLRTQESPGLARLYTMFAAEATDPSHPAHAFFKKRYERVREITQHAIRNGIAAGQVDASVEPRIASQQVLGLLDGLQLQWLLDPDLDLRAALRRSMRALLPAADSSVPPISAVPTVRTSTRSRGRR